MLKIYNVLYRKKQDFKCIDDKKVGMYTCGPTVYSYAHIGNLKSYVSEDVLKRVLMHDGYKVKHVMNITDVGHLVGDMDMGEDKVQMTARIEHKSAYDVARFYANQFFIDLKRLNVIMPDVIPKATEHVPQMLALIKRLSEKGYLYALDNGVYYDTSKFRRYGELAGMDFGKLNTHLKAGARVERAAGLRNITDFAVWRFAKGNEKEMVWDSEWGRGFPGWHIECSAMSMQYLGEHFDIHCGGIDHIPIHHTNEIAQSEAATGKKFVNYWVEMNFLTVNGAKFSKSLHNTYTLQDVIERGFSAAAVRLFFVSSHYRRKLNFTFEALKNMEKTLDGIYAFLERIATLDHAGAPDRKFTAIISKLHNAFFAALDNDINTPLALSKMHELISETNKRLEKKELSSADAKEVIEAMLDFDSILGVGMEKHIGAKRKLPDEVEKLIREREAARDSKDFARSDAIRKELNDRYGVVLEDTQDGTRWRFRRDHGAG